MQNLPTQFSRGFYLLSKLVCGDEHGTPFANFELILQGNTEHDASSPAKMLIKTRDVLPALLLYQTGEAVDIVAYRNPGNLDQALQAIVFIMPKDQRAVIAGRIRDVEEKTESRRDYEAELSARRPGAEVDVRTLPLGSAHAWSLEWSLDKSAAIAIRYPAPELPTFGEAEISVTLRRPNKVEMAEMRAWAPDFLNSRVYDFYDRFRLTALNEPRDLELNQFRRQALMVLFKATAELED